jgi:hypothetical protein
MIANKMSALEDGINNFSTQFLNRLQKVALQTVNKKFSSPKVPNLSSCCIHKASEHYFRFGKSHSQG